jgi:hypothetical protein
MPSSTVHSTLGISVLARYTNPPGVRTKFLPHSDDNHEADHLGPVSQLANQNNQNIRYTTYYFMVVCYLLTYT